MVTQRTLDVESMLFNAGPAGPTLHQHWFNVLCLQGSGVRIIILRKLCRTLKKKRIYGGLFSMRIDRL